MLQWRAPDGVVHQPGYADPDFRRTNASLHHLIQPPTSCRGRSKLTSGRALALAVLTKQAQVDQAQEVFKTVTDYLEGQPSSSFGVDCSVEIVTTAAV